jgi:uncharacterized membrane protein SpoIIM required for sporulation
MLKDTKELIVKWACVTVAILILGFVLAWMIKPDMMGIINWTDKKGFTTNKTQMDKFLQYVFNNGMKVPFQMFILALIPIPFVYYLPVALTAAITGVVFYLPFAPQLQDKVSFLSVFSGVVPHAAIELFAFIVLSAVLYRFNKAIRSFLFKKVNSDIGVGYALKKVAVVYGLVAFPLLVLAAFVEAFITPMMG